MDQVLLFLENGYRLRLSG